MKSLFISQPMRDKTDEEIMAEREKAIKEVEEKIGEEVSPIMSFFNTTPNNVNTGLWCLAKSLELLAATDICYFVDGWEDYRGCCIERECAEKYDVKIVE